MATQARQFDPFGARDTFDTGHGKAGIFRLSKLQDLGLGDISRLPFSIRLLLESLLRNCDGYEVTEEDVKNLAGWQAAAPAEVRNRKVRRVSLTLLSSLESVPAAAIWIG